MGTGEAPEALYPRRVVKGIAGGEEDMADRVAHREVPAVLLLQQRYFRAL